MKQIVLDYQNVQLNYIVNSEETRLRDTDSIVAIQF